MVNLESWYIVDTEIYKFNEAGPTQTEHFLEHYEQFFPAFKQKVTQTKHLSAVTVRQAGLRYLDLNLFTILQVCTPYW